VFLGLPFSLAFPLVSAGPLHLLLHLTMDHVGTGIWEACFRVRTWWEWVRLCVVDAQVIGSDPDSTSLSGWSSSFAGSLPFGAGRCGLGEGQTLGLGFGTGSRREDESL
jgi:hypothetical protein